MHAVVKQLESLVSTQIVAAVPQLAARPQPPAVLALCALAWHRWDHEVAPTRRYQECQAIELGWRAVDGWTAAEDIRAGLAQLLQAQLPAQWEALLQAARLFNYAYPVDVYIGNGDTSGYEPDCQALWRDFEFFREWFAAALPLSEALCREWITTAQVFWYHCRWQPDDSYAGTFSAPACGYLLAQAVTLESSYPIQYYRLYKQLPCANFARHAGDQAELTGGQVLALQSGLGLTYFYYAQFCQYHLGDFDQARAFYRRFLVAEPHCLPDNHFRLFSQDATQRNYPPSSQKAHAEIGNMYFSQGQFATAR